MLRAEIRKISINNANQENILLKDISFTLHPNFIYTLLGKNGSGKSTLIKSLTLLPDKRFFNIDGKIFWNEKNLFDLSEEELINLTLNLSREEIENLENLEILIKIELKKE